MSSVNDFWESLLPVTPGTKENETEDICRVMQNLKISHFSTKSPECFVRHFKVEEKEFEGTTEAKLFGLQLRTQPILGFFYRRQKIRLSINPIPSISVTQHRLTSCYCENLPCRYAVSLLESRNHMKEVEVEGFSWKNVICKTIISFLPVIPKLHKAILYLEKNAEQPDPNIYIKYVIQKLLPIEHHESKCIIILQNAKASFDYTSLLIDELKTRYDPGTLSLCGGRMDGLMLCDIQARRCKFPIDWLVVAIASENLTSWSLVIQDCQKNNISQKLLEFKSRIQLKKHSLGFLFSHDEPLRSEQWRANTFKEIFPRTQLASFHTEKQFGLNTLVNKREDEMIHVEKPRLNNFTGDLSQIYPLKQAAVFLILTYDE